MEERSDRPRPRLPRSMQLPPTAPLEAKAMALLAEWAHPSRAREHLRDTFVEVAGWAARQKVPLELLPELQALADLQGALPMNLQSAAVQPTAAPNVAAGTLVDVTLKGITPVLQSTLPFAEALKIADHPDCWADSAVQMTHVADAPLPANGSLWRHSLTKRTDFGTPLVGGLVTEETIHITAEGSTSKDGSSGYRRYTHVLASCATGAGLVEVVKDTGWIELSGDASGIQLRLQKEVTVRRPANDPMGAILSAGFSAELWLWAQGFFAAAGAARKPSPIAAKLPAKNKSVTAAQSGTVRVAVLGGGPAGLACAWLLSRPEDPDQQGRFAWDPPNGLQLQVKLVEKSCIPGGKAASARRSDGEKFRVQEHGLHVLMGCYANVLEVMRWTGSASELAEFGTTQLPSTAGNTLDDLWTVDAGPWPKPQKLQSLQQWSQHNSLDTCEAWQRIPPQLVERSRPVLFAFGDATMEATPLLRAFSALAASLSAQSARVRRVPSTSSELNRLVLPWLHARLMKTVVVRTAYLMSGGSPGFDEGDEIAPLARLMREFARAALVPTPADPTVAQTREWVELATTIAIGLDEAGLFPHWALDDPRKLLDPGYAQWVLDLQSLDTASLESWLVKNGIETGFVANSRVLASLTAALFTTPAGIAAGTFIHGMARLLLTYEGKPYRRMKGGTGEAFVGPIYDRLNTLGAVVTGTQVDSLEPGANGEIARAHATQHEVADPNDFKAHVGSRKGWITPPNSQAANNALTFEAEAFVLAIPPYETILPGTPAGLEADLQKIRSRATVGVQCWGDGQALFPDAIISAMPGPLRCAAHMSDLAEGQGFGVPLYACGDMDDAEADAWHANDAKLAAWLATYRPLLQQGAVSAHQPFKKVNDTRSERYTCADVATQAARRVAYDTGCPNLWIAGDWTRTAMSCGSIEGAVTSGLEAAQDILRAMGCTLRFPIVGSLT